MSNTLPPPLIDKESGIFRDIFFISAPFYNNLLIFNFEELT